MVTGRWMKTENVVDMCNNYLAIKRNMPFMTAWMNVEDIKPDTERQKLFSLTYMWHVKK